jgi:serine protease Do
MTRIRLLSAVIAAGLLVFACSKKDSQPVSNKPTSVGNTTEADSIPTGSLPAGYNLPVKGLPIAPRDIPLLEQLNREYIRVAQAVMPGVVNLFTTKPLLPGITFGDETVIIPFPNIPQKPPAKNGRRHAPKDNSMGSGVLISQEGHILTNGHVVKDAEEIIVQLHDNRRFAGKIIAYDEPSDLAILKIDAKNLQPMVWGDSSKVRIGEQVIAIGNPFGLSESISSGIVSAIGRNPGFGANSYEDFIQTTAAINPGNSGGALVNIYGELIGINTAIASTNRGFQGIAFALPSNLARFVAESLLKNGKVVRGYLGVTIQEIKPDLQAAFGLTSDEGSLVTEVAPNSPAAKAGLERGDVILRYDGRKVSDPAQLRLAVSQTPIGRDVTAVIIRQGKEIEVSLKVMELPVENLAASHPPGKSRGLQPAPAPEPTVQQGAAANADNPLSALTVATLEDATRKRLNLSSDVKGVVIVQVDPESVAEMQGLRIGDIIEEVRIKGEVGVERLTDVKSFFAAAKKVKPGQDLVLLVRRGRATNFVSLPAQR